MRKSSRVFDFNVRSVLSKYGNHSEFLKNLQYVYKLLHAQKRSLPPILSSDLLLG